MPKCWILGLRFLGGFGFSLMSRFLIFWVFGRSKIELSTEKMMAWFLLRLLKPFKGFSSQNRPLKS